MFTPPPPPSNYTKSRLTKAAVFVLIVVFLLVGVWVGRWGEVVQGAAPEGFLSAGDDATPVSASLKIEFTRIFALPVEFHSPIQAILEKNLDTLPPYDTFAVSAMEQFESWSHIVVVPSLVIDSGWQVYLSDEDIIQILTYKNNDGRITAILMSERNAPYLAQVVPAELIDFSSPDRTNTTYLFPWRANETWLKTNGWHSTNAIDFAPSTGPWDVLASEAGTLTQVCNDGYQAKLRVNHSGVTTGYLHLSAGSIPGDSLNQQISRGKILGSLYNGSVILPDSSTYCANISNKQFWTPCGCATGPHLHFETSDTGITIDGYSISQVANSSNGTQYRSSNNPDSSSGSQAELWSQAGWAGSRVWNGGTGFSNAPSANSFSLKLPSGWSAKTWRGDTPGGDERCWSESARDLTDFGWQNAIQSIEVWDHNVCETSDGQAELWSQAGWAGSRVWNGGTGFSNSPNGNSFSLKLPTGWSATTWRGDNRGGGDPRCWSASVRDLTDFGWQNAIQSIEVFNSDVCRTECNPNADQIALFVNGGFGGECVVKSIGEYPNPGAIGLPNDAVSSIKVGGNVKARLCRDDNFSGTCEEFTGDDTDLGNNSVGNDQVSSAKVERRTSPPDIPTLRSPGNGATLRPTDTVILEWNASARATEYAAEYWLLSSGDRQNSGHQPGTSWNIGQLAEGEYAWYVEAYNSAGWSGWSEIWKFTIQNANRLPNAPTSPSPPIGATLDAMPQLCWQNNGDPDGDPVEFRVDVWTAGYVRSEQSQWIDGNCWRPTTLSGNDTYFWAVSVRDNRGGAESSPDWSFTVRDLVGPSLTFTSPVGDEQTYQAQPDAGIVGFRIQASDNVAVSSIRFFGVGADGSMQFFPTQIDSTDPYTAYIKTRNLDVGIHRIGAEARDAAQNTAVKYMNVNWPGRQTSTPTPTAIFGATNTPTPTLTRTFTPTATGTRPGASPTPTPTRTPTRSGPTNTATPTRTPAPAWTWASEAENASLVPPMLTATDAAVSSCGYVHASQGEPNDGAISFSFTVSATGNYYVWGRAMGPSFGSDSFYIAMDGNAYTTFTISPVGTNWTWIRGPNYMLNAGAHTLRFKAREQGARLDKVIITNQAAFTPGASDVTACGGGTNTPTPTRTATATPTRITGQGVQLSLQPASVTAAVNSIFTLNVQVAAGTQAVQNAELYIHFDPALLQVVDANGAPATRIESNLISLNTELLNTVDNSAGDIRYDAGKLIAPFPTGTFTVATIRLKALTASAGANVVFQPQSGVFFNGAPILGGTSGAVIVIQAGCLPGQVALQGHATTLGHPITVAIFAPGGTTPITTQNTALTANGAFNVCGLTAGTYDITIKGSHSLSSKRTNVVAPSVAPPINFCTLLEGDANNDNRVAGADFSLLATAYNQCNGQTGFDARADFNDDGCVRGADFSLLATNYNRSGPIACTTTAGSSQSSLVSSQAGIDIPALTEPVGTVNLTFAPTSRAAQVGDIFTFDLMVEAGSQTVQNVDMYIDFDPAVLQVTDENGNPTGMIIVDPTTLTNTVFNAVDNAGGHISYSAGKLSAPYPTGTFRVATVRFKKISTSALTSVSYASGSDVFFTGASVLGSLGSATVTQPGETPTNTPTSTPTATPTFTPTRTPTATLTSTRTPSATATRTHTATVTSIATATSTPTPTRTPTWTATATRTPTVTRTATTAATPTSTATTSASPDFVKIAAGGWHTCALTASGGVKCWGSNWAGQLGDGTVTDRNAPVDVSGLTSGVTALAAGGEHTCALLNDGRVKCWGSGFDAAPIDVSGLTSEVTALAAGGDHTCALTSASGVKCWGWNSSGQLGDGTTTNRYTPDYVSGLTVGVTAITAGTNHTCALMTSGSVKCWGNNREGQLGDGTNANRNTPVLVSSLTNGLQALTAGANHTCALTTSGGVKCWGSNFDLVPMDIAGLMNGVAALTAGRSHTCALTTGGGAKCWGSNWNGELGDGTNLWRGTPVSVVGLTSGVTALTAGGSHTCALLNNSSAKCWGWDGFGQLGDGTITFRSVPVDVSAVISSLTAMAAGYSHTCGITTSGRVQCWHPDLIEVDGLTDAATALAAGDSHTCALTTGGGVECWGANWSGQLGDGTNQWRDAPVDTTGLASGVAALAAGHSHTCALTIGGGVKCWGENRQGQLGDGTITNRSLPVNVSGLASGVKALAAGGNHTCAVTTAGSVKCWGANWSGQLGDGTTDSRITPVDVMELPSGVTSLAAGYSHTCALVASGGVKCWGYNGMGQLGDGTIDSNTSPVDVMGLASGATVLVTGDSHSCALMTNGSVKCWGWNGYGQLGDGTTSYRSIPTNVSGLAGGSKALAAGTTHTCVITTNGRPKCWGADMYGQLGLGAITQRLTPVNVVASGAPELRINYPSGRAGSYFTLTGANFPANTVANVKINEQTLIGTIPINETGQFTFFLSAASASTGDYQVTVSVNPSASAFFSVQPNASTRIQEGGGQTLVVPGSAGAALPKVYLPSQTEAASSPHTLVNLALHRPTSASSSEGAEDVSGFGNDGGLDTRWSSRHHGDAGDVEEWWKVDLRGAKLIRQVNIYWEAAYASDYSIVWSNSPNFWEGEFRVTRTEPGLAVANIGTITARYVGVVMRAHSEGIDNYSFWEFEVYGQPSIAQQNTHRSRWGSSLANPFLPVPDHIYGFKGTP